ncbi:acyl CoA:acetate/3-ketoacid CoA transferase [Telmatospirillum sp. J64-1]|uniref:acyl CoA:acetate/3-ketoacid CoA transferase n=1 Tax=Telmatospirillum sp. J64-1 TaxID=2502183 RepID=UPI00115D776A|nr:CoA-transferase [Telmatospirillum sp. J64-1]
MEVISAERAAQLIKPNDSVIVSGSGGGHAVPEAVIAALGNRYESESQPGNLTLIHVVGIGDRVSKGAAHFAKPGMVKRVITSALIDSPVFIDLAFADKIEAYTLPQGVLSQIMREIAAGRPGLITKTGLHTFIDPRQAGGRQSPSAKEDLVELMEIGGEEWLRFKPFPIDVAILRGTTADEDGNVSMEEEAILGEMLSTAQAARRNGGKVIVQVKRLAKRGTLPGKSIKIPGILVDYVVVDPEQRQTYATHYNPSYAGELRVPLESFKPLPFTPRKVIARRAALELRPGAVCNLGAGISTGISAVAAEEKILDHVILTNEQGFIGGAPLTGPDSGAAQNYSAAVDQPYQFDFYDGGGIDCAFLSFVEVDPNGNVNISRFANKIVGIGGFINISQNAKKTVFSGTFTAGGLDVACVDGKIEIRQEGKYPKFVKSIEQICYCGPFATQQGRKALFVTERAVFEIVDGQLTLIEIAPGVELERDILAHMAFKPRIASDLKTMDARLFRPEVMELAKDAAFATAQS